MIKIKYEYESRKGLRKKNMQGFVFDSSGNCEKRTTGHVKKNASSDTGNASC